jgi:hypothetical protein
MTRSITTSSGQHRFHQGAGVANKGRLTASTGRIVLAKRDDKQTEQGH